MQRVLRTDSIDGAMAAAGLSQAAVARELDVSREAVSRWLRGRSSPRPDKLLRLALLLDLTLDQMVERVPDSADPVVAFRKMEARKTTEAHLARAQKMGRLLTPVVPYLPFDELVAPPCSRTRASPTTTWSASLRRFEPRSGWGRRMYSTSSI